MPRSALLKAGTVIFTVLPLDSCVNLQLVRWTQIVQVNELIESWSPILLRQYAKIGGKLLGFNVDRKFSNVLDGLVVVDLRQTNPAVLERYMGRDAAQTFRKIHGVRDGPVF